MYPVIKIPIKLKASCLVKSNSEDFLECALCSNIAWEPRQCSGIDGCERIFCGGCLDTWYEKRKCCPGCKREDFTPAFPSLVVRKLLERMIFSCAVCNNRFPYNDAGEHLSKCNAPKVACLLGCSKEAQFTSWEQMEDHLEHACPLLPHICCNCGEARTSAQSHNCENFLLKRVKYQEDEIYNLRRVISQFEFAMPVDDRRDHSQWEERKSLLA